MTELEQFKAMLDRSGAGFSETKDDRQPGVAIEVGNHGELGYFMFNSVWWFDEETGKLLTIAHWE